MKETLRKPLLHSRSSLDFIDQNSVLCRNSILHRNFWRVKRGKLSPPKSDHPHRFRRAATICSPDTRSSQKPATPAPDRGKHMYKAGPRPFQWQSVPPFEGKLTSNSPCAMMGPYSGPTSGHALLLYNNSGRITREKSERFAMFREMRDVAGSACQRLHRCFKPQDFQRARPIWRQKLSPTQPPQLCVQRRKAVCSLRKSRP